MESVTIGIDPDGRLGIVRLNPPVKRDVREGTMTVDTRDYPYPACRQYLQTLTFMTYKPTKLTTGTSPQVSSTAKTATTASAPFQPFHFSRQ